MNLNQITLPSTNIEHSIEFYNNLGLQLIVKNLPHYARFLCPEGNSTLSVHLVGGIEKSDFIVYFECENVDEIVSGLIKKGITFTSDPENQPWLWREAYTEDPDGNVICLFYAGVNRVNPPWRI